MSVHCRIGAESRMCSRSAAGAAPSARAVTVSTIPPALLLLNHCDKPGRGGESGHRDGRGEAEAAAADSDGLLLRACLAKRAVPGWEDHAVLQALGAATAADAQRRRPPAPWLLASGGGGGGGRSGRAAARGRHRKTGRRAAGVKMRSTVFWSGSH
jgi:hypothetical protein